MRRRPSGGCACRATPSWATCGCAQFARSCTKSTNAVRRLLMRPCSSCQQRAPSCAAGFERSAHQERFHDAFLRACSRVLYREEWAVHRSVIMTKNQWASVCSEIMISTPRYAPAYAALYTIAPPCDCLRVCVTWCSQALWKGVQPDRQAPNRPTVQSPKPPNRARLSFLPPLSVLLVGLPTFWTPAEPPSVQRKRRARVAILWRGFGSAASCTFARGYNSIVQKHRTMV